MESAASPASTMICVGLDLDALAAVDQFVGVMLVAEDLREPVAQVGGFLREAVMLRDDLVLAPLQRLVEVGDDRDVLR